MMARRQTSESLKDWQRGLVDWLEIDLNRALTSEEYGCLDWDRSERTMSVVRLPLLLEVQDKKISEVRSESGAKHA